MGDHLRKTNKNLNDEIYQLKNKNTNLNNQIKLLKKYENELKNDISIKDNKINEANDRFNKNFPRMIRIDNLEYDIRKLLNDNNNRKKENEYLRDALKIKNEEIDEMTSKLIDVRDVNIGLENKYLNTNTNKNRNSTDNIINKKEEQINKLEK